jgi:hypothetical protein
VGIAKDSKDESFNDILDFTGDTEEAMKKYNPHYLNDIFWTVGAPLPALEIAKPEVSSKVKDIYFDMMLHHPQQFFKHKLKVWLLVSGIKEPLLEPSRGIHYVDEPTESLEESKQK